ncbi:NADPH dehydrogenase NamA [Spirosoma taeanense]|uniref:NADPH dehydrogenase NamA n=1 Tax=Spirosoma taeanense TaxID=2735870 RepID=A0A6M5YBD0_9BACT|nr:NADPH dehydrogenase NamA [Spirosoma taeanense]QJW90844.1 NADPH dehydrogenase NamA [Spirosoma taeanense]
MSILFSPLTLRRIQLKNRIVVSPMCQYSSQDGFANDWHLVHLGSRAVGGAGLVITEATAVSPEGRITPDDLGIWSDEHIPGLQRITQFIRASSSVAGIQLAHAGRKASHRRPWDGGTAIAPTEERGWQTVAPSALPFLETEPVPTALTSDGLEKVLADFQAAAIRSREAGFQVIEIHAAHGYLLHEFLSPLSNHRTDAYGGSFDNRIRLLLEVIERVQTVWPADLPLFVRISATDWTEGGWTADDSVALAAVLKTKRVDVVDCSTGGNVPRATIPVGPGYQVSFAERIKQETGMPTAAVGIITSAEQAESILANGQADLILLAREFLRDPYFPLHAAHQLGDDLAWPVQYERAKPR